ARSRNRELHITWQSKQNIFQRFDKISKTKRTTKTNPCAIIDGNERRPIFKLAAERIAYG
uniref:Uncharacterized protein n=1 Tax=Romanomermis culicivorax TaxID=13658 RepID=A0A915IK47_ROMCU